MRIMKLLVYICLIGTGLAFISELLKPKNYHTIPWRAYEREDS